MILLRTYQKKVPEADLCGLSEKIFSYAKEISVVPIEMETCLAVFLLQQ